MSKIEVGGEGCPITSEVTGGFIAVDLGLIVSAGELVVARRWGEAAAAYRAGCGEDGSGVGELTIQDQLKRNLALNMAEMAEYRPGVFAVLERAASDPRFAISITPSGRPSITFTAPGQAPHPLADGPDPVAFLSGVMQQLLPARKAGKSLGIYGGADGYLLMALARHPIALPLGKQQCVHYFEPNPGNLVACMLIHDFSGEHGPIRQKRFQWWVGNGVSGCIDAYRAGIGADLYLPFPAVTIAAQPDGAAIVQGVQAVTMQAVEADRRRAGMLESRYAASSLDRYIDAIGATPSRKPRALLLTTKFSTVLQYSTADIAHGLRELGWETETTIEPTGHHELTLPQIREQMLRFDPDVVIQIDHTRAEHGQLFPKELPFICWAQDHLPNLTTPDSGRQIGKRDFFLTSLGPWYERMFAYPAEQIIPLTKLTRMPEIPESWETDGVDLVYASNASKTPEAALAELVKSFHQYPDAARIGEAAGERLIELYGQGRSFAAPLEVGEVIDGVAGEMGIVEWVGRPELVAEMFERVNNLLYRQQALGWVADVADEMGLTLEIYGSGWEKIDRFAKYARGVVQYGEALEKLTRKSRINLQIVPYFCLHQRLLDGIAAGGFFLVRSHPSDTSIQQLAKFVLSRLPEEVGNMEAARALMKGGDAAELERLAGLNQFLADRVDPIELCRIYLGAGFFAGGAEMPPRIREVSFSGKDEVRERIKRFLNDAGLRREVVMEQRSMVEGVLSYRYGMKRVMSQIHDRLSVERVRMRAAV